MPVVAYRISESFSRLGLNSTNRPSKLVTIRITIVSNARLCFVK